MKKVFILIGAPGSGKGTLSKILLSENEIAHISSGDMLRDLSSKDTSLAIEIKDTLAKGKLVDDIFITKMINDRIAEKDCDNGFILDGYPRTLNQAKLLDNIFKTNNITAVYAFSLNIAEEILIKRITGRYSCENCGAIYNKYTATTKVEGVCDKCAGINFITREDDNFKTFTNRLNTFNAQAKDIVDFYQKLGILNEFDANLNKEELKEQLIKIIN